MRKILITGAAGFTGVNLVPALLQRGYSVRVLIRQTTNLQNLNGLDCEPVFGDIRDPDVVRRALQGCDLVFHLAALVAYWNATREEVYSVNAEGTRVVMQECLKAEIEKVVHTSSVSAIGIPSLGEVATEKTPFDARSRKIAYSDSKRLAELHVQNAVQQGLNGVIVNPAQIMGPGDHGMYMGNVLRTVKRGYIPVVPSGGLCVVDVNAVVAGLMAAADHGQIGQRYILGGENLSYLEICTNIADVVGRRAPRHIVPRWFLPPIARAVDAYNSVVGKADTITGEHVLLGADQLYYDSSKAISELGFAILPFRDALSNAYQWYKVNGYLE